MDSKASCIVLLALSSLLSASNAFNITKILANYPDFSTFNSLLSSSGLADEINSRQTITILAVANSSVDSVSGKDLSLVKRILSTHVILDYYDTLKLSKLKKSTIMTTLYQASGVADDQQGFLNCTKSANGYVFGSAMKGAPLTSSLIGGVMSQPYNISVLQVSSVIEAPGIESMSPPPPPAPATPAPKQAPAPAAATPPEAPAPSDDDAASPSEADAPSDDIAAPSEAPAPEEAADSPASSPADADSDEADAEAPSSGSSRLVAAGGVAVAGLVATVLGF